MNAIVSSAGTPASKIKAEPSEDEDEEDIDEMKKTEAEEEEEAAEIDLDGIDDDEIDGLILSEEEVKVKTLVWCRLNAMYLQVRNTWAIARNLAQFSASRGSL